MIAEGNPTPAKRNFPPDTYVDIRYFGLDLTRLKDVIYGDRMERVDCTLKQS